jgi:alpha-beta hydrolase superfamily lysophospholipase
MIPYSKIDQSEIIALLFPTQSISPSPCPDNAEDVHLMVDSGVVLNCRYYFKEQDAPVLFYFPETGCSQDSFDMVAQGYLNKGINVFLASYRGCGKNSGSPSIGAMYSDSEILFGLAMEWVRGKACSGPIFVMGQSLGSICAIDTVSRNSDLIKGLILESAVCGTASYLEAMGVSPEHADISEQEGFNTVEKIEKIKTPTLILHGARDGLVPIAEAERIQASSAARNKQFIVIPGAEHHTVGITGGDLYIQTIKQFTDTVCGVNTWRQKRKSHISNQKDKKR